MIKGEPGSYSLTCTNTVAHRFMLVGPAMEQITVRENAPALGTQVNLGGGVVLVQWSHRAMILEPWGILQISVMGSAGNLQPVNASFIHILSARNCAKYHHSIQAACTMNMHCTPYCLMLVQIINPYKHAFERGFLFSMSCPPCK